MLLDAVRDQPHRGEYLVAFFGCLYDAGVRPAEVVALGLPSARYQLPTGDGFCFPNRRSRSIHRWRVNPRTYHRDLLWLNNGVHPTEVARRLGHQVAVLLKVYANCIDGPEDTINGQITAALAAGQDHETLPAATAVQHAAQPTRGPEPRR